MGNELLPMTTSSVEIEASAQEARLITEKKSTKKSGPPFSDHDLSVVRAVVSACREPLVSTVVSTVVTLNDTLS